MKIFGVILILITIIIIGKCCENQLYNEKVARESPFTTWISGGANLKKTYTFQPPYTEFELVTLGIGGLGVLLVVFGGSSKS
jgi:hypothetical protein